MSVTICWQWIAFLMLLRGISAQGTTTIHLYTSDGCTGSHMSCGDIPENERCTTGGALFASAFLATSEAQSLIDVHAEVQCRGVSETAGPIKCSQPSFAFSATSWSISSSSVIQREETVGNLTKFEDCRRPDLITLVTEDGQEITIKVPEGENTDYEHAFVEGNYSGLMKLADINRNLRFFR